MKSKVIETVSTYNDNEPIWLEDDNNTETTSVLEKEIEIGNHEHQKRTEDRVQIIRAVLA